MINTVSQLLEEFKKKEVSLLKKYHIVNHPTIIGNMYENLTKEILNRALFSNIDLRVVAGKIVNETTKQLSPEIDCMLVFGNGNKIPYTDKFIYESSQVIAIIEVKKNLFSKELKDSHRTLINALESIDYSARQHELYHTLHKGAYKILCHDDLYDKEELNQLTIEKQMIYNSIALESYLPLRIVWGYEGFKSEYMLRESFFRYMENTIPQDGYKRGFSPVKLPSLIICDNYSLIKNNGIPFAHPIDADNEWRVYASSSYNPVYFFLEMIWTKIHFMFGLSAEIFGDDMNIDVVHNFLRCVPSQDTNGVLGWIWRYLDAPSTVLQKPANPKPWEPRYITEEQFIILQMIFKNGEVYIDEPLVSFLEKSSIKLEDFLLSISKVGLFYVRDNKIMPLYDDIMTGISKEGKYFAEDNSTGQVTRWIKMHL